jgi:hypothetical protein
MSWWTPKLPRDRQGLEAACRKRGLDDYVKLYLEGVAAETPEDMLARRLLEYETYLLGRRVFITAWIAIGVAVVSTLISLTRCGG